MHVLVTGGSGFIGSHLCAALLSKGHRVTCVDNLSTGSSRNVEPWLSHSDFTFLQHDIVLPLPEEVAPDIIFHLASPASVPDYLARPLETLSVNSDGTRAMLELARRHDAKLLFTSTSEIYGDPLIHPQPETYWGNVGTLGPRACYDEAKRFGEALVMAYVRVHEVDARIVRIFNTYGPHSRPDDGRIVPNFVMQALRNEPITIYGDGSQTRSFCYVSDIVQGLLSAMFSAGTRGEVFNLGNPDEYTVRDFAQQIARLVGSVAGVEYLPLPADDPTRRCPDISKARRMLHWEPTTDLETGMDLTIRWFRDALSAMAPVS